MIEHIVPISSAVVVGVAAVVVKYSFVTKKECRTCHTDLCKKIDNVANASKEKADALTLGARDNVAALAAIQREISGIRADMNRWIGRIDTYMKDRE